MASNTTIINEAAFGPVFNGKISADEELLNWLNGNQEKLQSITKLCLFNKGLKNFPSNICDYCPNLRALDLRNNQITELDPKIGNLTSLDELELDNNQLQSLPKEIEKLTGLIRLTLSNNKLKEFPLGILNMKDLNGLVLSNNNLTSIPSNIGEKLPNLTILHLKNNKLTRLPKSISRLNLQTRRFNTEDNPFNSMPRVLVDKYGFKDITVEEESSCIIS